MSGRVRTSLAALVLGAVLVALVAAPATQTARSLTPAEELELKTLTGQLNDSARQPKTRVEAAELLLTRTYPHAGEALKAALADTSNVGGQVAVAEAIARSGEDRPEFIEPLMAMLTGEEASCRSPAARALTVYNNNGVAERLIAIAKEANRPLAVRTEVIAGLQRILDQKVVGALVELLDDPEPAVAEGSAQSLARLTNLRAFGNDSERWKEWWKKNAGKPRSQWLAELASSLARSQADLESENGRLRDRLVKAMEDLYASAAPAQRDAMLLGYLKDSAGDVRLAGTRILEKRLAAAEKLPPEFRPQVQAMLADSDVRVRARAALLVGAMGESNAGKVLLERLAVDEPPEVRKAVLTALGQVADLTTLAAVLDEVKGKRADVAAAAARAVARIAAKQKLEGPIVADVAKVLSGRYKQLTRAMDGVELPEALVTAMGAVGCEEFLPVLIEATKDPAATIRLAALGGLKQSTKPEVAPVIEGLVTDSDRAVRQAAISALGARGGQKNLQIVLARTNPATESDAAVRQQAWDSVMGLLAKADAPTLKSVVAGLASRTDAVEQRIKLRQMLSAALKAAKDAEYPESLRQLAQDLAQAARPSEAATALADAYSSLAAAKDAKAEEVWYEWVEAMLAADDPGATKALADQSNEKAFALGLQKLEARVDALVAKAKWQAVMQLCAAAEKNLGSRLSAEQAKPFQTKARDAKAKLAEADRQKVPALVAQLTASEEASRKAAAAELQAMGDRAVVPLVEELRKSLSGDSEDQDVESAVIEVLKQVAPKLTGYDPAAPKADRIKTLEGWLKSRGA